MAHCSLQNYLNSDSFECLQASILVLGQGFVWATPKLFILTLQMLTYSCLVDDCPDALTNDTTDGWIFSRMVNYIPEFLQ